MDNTDLQAVLSGFLPSLLATLTDAPINDAATERDDHRADEELKRLKSLVLVGQQVDGDAFGALVSYLSGLLIAAYGH